MSQLIDELRELYKQSGNGARDLIKRTVEALQGYAQHVEALDQELVDLRDVLADHQAQLEGQPLYEAPGSINLRMVDPETGATPQYTYRFHSPKLANAAWPEIKRDLAAMGLISEEQYQEQRRAQRAEAAPAPAGPAAPPPAAGGTLPPVAGGQPAGDLTFEAKTLEGERKKGKNYWKVKGGKFSRHGVTIWEEVLTAAGFVFEALNPDEVYSLAGYVAHYELDPESGNPKKVTHLEKR